MKNSIIALCCLGIVMITIFLIIIYDPGTDYNEDGKRFVCIVTPEAEYYWGDVKSGIKQADIDFGTYTRFSVFERFDIEKQIRLLEETKYMKVDGIITLGEPYSKELNEKILERVNSGIPVVLLDRDSETSGRNCYIGSDNYQAGQLAAEQIKDNTNGQTQIMVFVTGINDANQKERLLGFQSVVEREEGMEIVEIFESHRDKVELQDELKNAFNKYQNLNAIFCVEASTSQQVGLFLKNNRNYTGLSVVMFDDLPPVYDLIQEGVVTSTLLQKGFDMGYHAVEYLMSYSEQEYMNNKQYTDVICVTQDNIQEYIRDTESGQGL